MKWMIPTLLLFSSLSFARDVMKPDTSGCRRRVIRHAFFTPPHSTSVILENDHAEDLVYEPSRFIRDLKSMDKLKTGVSKIKPWSDSYWPLFKGGIGQRYMNDLFFNFNWREAYHYVLENPVQELIQRGKYMELSPAEKYDMLLDLEDLPLTMSSWLDGQDYFDQYGSVETWMGLCHGWAAASMMVPEPRKQVSIKTKFGEAVFYPSDIKALNTLLWAKGNFKTRFIGGRCNSKKPDEDRNGRPTDEACLDNNPGTFHLVVVNQLGLSRMPFIMDASYNEEVWNHPVFAYKYSYFNPKTKMFTDNLNDALVPVGEWDKSRKKRASQAKYIVGIEMGLTYAVENQPSHDENQETEVSHMQLNYDLELDENGIVVGGEWSENAHPDFLWVPEPKTFPMTLGDTSGEVDFGRLTPQVKSAARKNAEHGLPLGLVVRTLTRKSAN